MPQHYQCPACDNEWEYTGNTCTTFRDESVQTWNGDKTTCGTEGKLVSVPLADKKVAVSVRDNGTGKTYTR
jgi:hypothetical protein